MVETIFFFNFSFSFVFTLADPFLFGRLCLLCGGQGGQVLTKSTSPRGEKWRKGREALVNRLEMEAHLQASGYLWFNIAANQF